MNVPVGMLFVVMLAAALDAQVPQPEAQLARVDVRQVDGQQPVLEVVANTPLAYSVLTTVDQLELRIYGVKIGTVPPDQQLSIGRVTLTAEEVGNVRLRLLTPQPADFTVRLGSRSNVIEIRRR